MPSVEIVRLLIDAAWDQYIDRSPHAAVCDAAFLSLRAVNIEVACRGATEFGFPKFHASMRKWFPMAYKAGLLTFSTWHTGGEWYPMDYFST